MEWGVGSEGLAQIKNKQLFPLPVHFSIPPACTNNPSSAIRRPAAGDCQSGDCKSIPASNPGLHSTDSHIQHSRMKLILHLLGSKA